MPNKPILLSIFPSHHVSESPAAALIQLRVARQRVLLAKKRLPLIIGLHPSPILHHIDRSKSKAAAAMTLIVIRGVETLLIPVPVFGQVVTFVFEGVFGHDVFSLFDLFQSLGDG